MLTSAGSCSISVIMPCHNAAPYVTEAVQSVLGQTWGDLELLAVDDGSSDGSHEILRALVERHGGRMRLLKTNHIGPYPARNHALRDARGDFVAFLDADDWWLPETLQKLRAALVQHEADIAYCGWHNVGDGAQSAPYVPPAYEDEDPIAHFLRSCPWPIHAALLRRNLVEQLGGFCEGRYTSMDYDFWLRALALTRRIKRVPEVLAYYRWHGSGQVSAVKWRQVLDALEAQRNFIRSNPALVAHINPDRLKDLTEGHVLRQAYRALWKRDLVSAQRLFRHVAVTLSFGLKDLGHVVTAFLPLPLYRGLTKVADRRTA